MLDFSLKYKEDNKLILEIKNIDLKKVSDLLAVIELNAKASRARVKLNRKLADKLNDFAQDIEELKHEYKGEELNKHFADLIIEKAVIDVTENRHLLMTLKNELNEYDKPLKEDDAIAHDILLEELERIGEENGLEEKQTKNGDDE